MMFGFLGFGKLASALLEVMLEAKCCAADDVLVINRHPEDLAGRVSKLGIRLASNSRQLVQQADTVILGTKPVDSLQLLREVRQYLDGKLLISVVAGISLGCRSMKGVRTA